MKHFLKEIDFDKAQLLSFIDSALDFKAKKKAKEDHAYLSGLNIALLFEKPSTRTRAAFTVAAQDLGMQVTYLGVSEIQMGKKESVADTAKVLGSMFDGIEYRGFSQQIVEDLAENANVPVWNGLTDEWHPTQMIADFMTLKEHFGYLEGLNLTYIGDGRNNVANSLLVTAAKLGVNITIIAPKSLQPDQEVIDLAKIQSTGGTIHITDDITAAKGSDAIYTDVWLSMGEDAEFKERIDLLWDYQVNQNLLDLTENPEVIVLHCLPAFHNTKTEISKTIYETYGYESLEITDEVFQAQSDIIFQEAENRLHSIKAILYWSLK
ncbi:ornithine carbamoyltransferase [Streptococcus hyovaginalis]|uniref:ornithine carbamoyltransferase n=1 Tax=Streptococcus hyovaginalis TaxID=149015 RepID=UPI002A916D57|nr:ornithine carbamoyltransferase [Streptococcus hyovaginalis]MDY5974163.1 ornithine carbamoyltransferase [Streptococcus hyovaginalis]